MRYAVLEETEKRAVCRALIEERARYCSFVSMLKPVLVSPALGSSRPPAHAPPPPPRRLTPSVPCAQDHEINMLGEVTHLQSILEDLINLTAEPSKLPPSSEQVSAPAGLRALCRARPRARTDVHIDLELLLCVQGHFGPQGF